MDVDSDGKISFSELMSHLTNNAGHVTDMQLRAAMLNETALVATGAAIPLILKGKGMIFLGTLFYDPVRLFRDFYVDYFHALKSKRMAGEKIAKEDIKDLFTGMKRGFKAGFKIRTTALVVLAICVDCAVGACVFLVYAKVRAELQKRAQQKFLQMQNDEDELQKKKKQQEEQQMMKKEEEAEEVEIKLISPCLDSAASAAATEISKEESDEPDEKKIIRKRLNFREVFFLEATSGAAAGAFAGLLTPLAKRLLSRDLLWPDSSVGTRTWLRVRHGMASHAAFFSGFFFFRNMLSRLAFKKLKFESNTFSDAIITTISGCCAGGCWKVASEPLKNRDEWVLKNSVEAWRKLPPAMRFQIRTKGLGWALAQTMPVTGVAFLIYEASFAYLL